MEIRTMKEEERKYTYRQSMQINGMTGYIGYDAKNERNCKYLWAG